MISQLMRSWRWRCMTGLLLILVMAVESGLSAADIALLPAQVTGIDATSDRTVNCLLPAGVTLTGSITSEADVLIVGGSVTARSADTSFEGPIQFSPLDQSARYEIVLPPGRYRLSVRAVFVVEETGSTLTVTFAEGEEMTVNDSTVHDLRVPSPPPVVRVRGTVRNLGDLDVERAAILFATEDGMIQASTALTEEYTLAVPVGRYVVSALGLSPLLPDELSELLNLELERVMISGDATVDVTLPPLVEVKGTIKMATGDPAITAQITVSNVDEQTTRAAVVISADATGGQYRLLIPAGSYDAIAFVTFLLEEETQGVLGFPISTRRFHADAGVELDFTIPPIGPIVTISGRVTDSQGDPVGGAFILASSVMLTDMPDTFFTAGVLSEDDGTFQIKVISGQDYTVVCTPPPQ
ncbi:MAG TPA: carboxypeptidase-like regulatory domain-containing protein [Blastocatellia bacterium]|nr:carboxypeptidase-like regulatory domain-containing protein [Blastocatellia bacterium]